MEPEDLSRYLKHTDLKAKRNEQHGNSSPDVWSNLHLKPFLNHVVLRRKKQEKWNETNTSISSLTFIKISSPKITGLKGLKSYIVPKDRNPLLHLIVPAQLPLLKSFTPSLAQSLRQPSRMCFPPGAQQKRPWRGSQASGPTRLISVASTELS